MSRLLIVACAVPLVALAVFLSWFLARFKPPPPRPAQGPQPQLLSWLRFGDSITKGASSVLIEGQTLHITFGLFGSDLKLPLSSIKEITKVDPTAEFQLREFESTLHPGEVLDFGQEFNEQLSAVLTRRSGPRKALPFRAAEAPAGPNASRLGQPRRRQG